jgi:hypothetical protein
VQVPLSGLLRASGIQDRSFAIDRIQSSIGPVLLQPTQDLFKVSRLCLTPRHFGFPLLWPRNRFALQALNKREISRAKKL